MTRRRSQLAAVGLTLCLGGCSAYGDSYSFANTRKLLDSNAPDVTRVVFAPFVGMFDALASPATTYADAARRAPEDEHLYLSFVGLRTLWASELSPAYAVMGTLLVGTVDLGWFAAAGICDVVYALFSDLEEPADRPPPLRDLFTPTRARASQRGQTVQVSRGSAQQTSRQEARRAVVVDTEEGRESPAAPTTETRRQPAAAQAAGNIRVGGVVTEGEGTITVEPSRPPAPRRR
jgi:hypothetical protein